MKKEVKPSSHRLLAVYRVTAALALLLALLIAGGSVFYAVLGKPESPLFNIGGARNKAAGAEGRGGSDSPRNAARPAAGQAGNAASVFTGIGRLRIPLAAPAGGQAGTMILSIAFPYPLNDPPFTEELAARVPDFRSIAVGYFSSLPPGELRNPDEEKAKKEILKRYNAALRLGRIETLYFSDLMIVE
ncbi:MAG: flagellar basal body-associated FliL family protein [Treponema sp.]|jgi:flagellar basal body-associated protein FliL|nr:flagellar basal body-associated FliL family protein [Treponema sp.]